MSKTLKISKGTFKISKGTNTQHSGHEGQIFNTEKTIEIQLVRPTEVCGKA